MRGHITIRLLILKFKTYIEQRESITRYYDVTPYKKIRNSLYNISISWYSSLSQSLLVLLLLLPYQYLKKEIIYIRMFVAYFYL